MSGSGGLIPEKRKATEESEVPVGALGVLVEVKEELEDDGGCIGDAMRDFMRRHGGESVGTSGYGGLVPGVEAFPGGRVPELLGLTDEEIAQALPSRALGPFVPYLGEPSVAVGTRRGVVQARGRLRVRPRSAGRGRLGRCVDSLSERRRKRKRAVFGAGRSIRLLSNVNREPRNRPLQVVRHEGV